MRKLLLAVVCPAAALFSWHTSVAQAAGSTPVQGPGLSAALFANPGYTCVANLYVSTTGSDTTGDGSIGSPLATLQKANSRAPTAGTCVNVEPGVYSLAGTGISLYHRGNAATPTGYVVYRSTTLGGAVLRETAPYGGGVIKLAASYLWLDGFEIDGNATGCSGKPCAEDYNVGVLAGSTTHHQWFTNNYSHGGGGGGFGAAGGGDCAWLIHNVATDNAATNTYEESGISIWEPHAVSGVTACDASGFHFHIQWNIAAGNMEGPSIPGWAHTDGDGIILDTFSGTSYPYTSLVADNLGYNNGGFCVGEDNSSNITFANNTCYDNYLDPLNTGTYRGELWANGGSKNTFVNNVAQAIPGSGMLSYNISAITYGGANQTTWSNNVFFGPNPKDHTSGHSDPISCTSNKCSTNPLWVSPATGNFALQSGSPARNYGLIEPYLPAWQVDAGACSGGLTSCP
jgi:hypothetical protein